MFSIELFVRCQRCFNVSTTTRTLGRRCMDVKMRLRACWVPPKSKSAIIYNLNHHILLLTVILIAFGTVLGLLLVVLAYTIRKYLLQRQVKIDLLSDEKESKAGLFAYMHLQAGDNGDDKSGRHGKDDDSFLVPFVTRPVRRQVPSFGLGEKACSEVRLFSTLLKSSKIVFFNSCFVPILYTY